MHGASDGRAALADGAWPWEQRTGSSRRARAGDRLRRVCSLPVLTAALLTAGYAWLGLLVGHGPGAVTGALLGLVTSGALRVAVGRAVSGPRRRCPPSARRRGAR
ncbi:hypothetical protein ACIPPJ_09455 [Streptomyces sp. NPDC086091]|uniref:hypothetical protein n=1 Tax=Streptomyces sp. NPDC086091 TaxID=3365751 RepID=UPI0037FCCA9E